VPVSAFSSRSRWSAIGLVSKKWACADALEDGFSDSLRNLGVCLGSGLLQVEGSVVVLLVG
jgi:hypothetical protein